MRFEGVGPAEGGSKVVGWEKVALLVEVRLEVGSKEVAQLVVVRSEAGFPRSE